MEWRPRQFSDRRQRTGVSNPIPLQCGTANVSISTESDGKLSCANTYPVKFHILVTLNAVSPVISAEPGCCKSCSFTPHCRSVTRAVQKQLDVGKIDRPSSDVLLRWIIKNGSNMSALDDMLRNSRQIKTWFTRHIPLACGLTRFFQSKSCIRKNCVLTPVSL